MKKVLLVVCAIAVMITCTGCSSDETQTTMEATSFVETIEVETILIEDVLYEDILYEDVIVSDEYLEELEYNSMENDW